ncbi:unnamed protein product [Amoebophrya sp. A25]|nr:unnamed protein product [Amoebophrya sp. A25]|eukprot:GSA25T00005754001.1
MRRAVALAGVVVAAARQQAIEPEIGSSRKGENPWNTYRLIRLSDGTFHTSNPYIPERPFRVLDNLEPEAPLSATGYEEEHYPQEHSAPGGAYVFLPKYRYGIPFPEEHPPQPEPSKGASLVCRDLPATWVDAANRGCEHYRVRKYCTEDGAVGDGWDAEGGATIQDLAHNSLDALQACCICGGGSKRVVFGTPVIGLDTPHREIHAPMDKLPLDYYPLRTRTGYSSHGNIPQAYRSKEAVAPADDIDEKYKIYFSQIYDREHATSATGLSAQYFGIANTPTDWTKGWQPKNVAYTNIAPFLDFRSQSNQLLWPQAKNTEPVVWWSRFSGTLKVLQAGTYMFDLALGTDDNPATLIVDGEEVLTHGQCRVFTSKQACEDRGCQVISGGLEAVAAQDEAASLLQTRKSLGAKASSSRMSTTRTASSLTSEEASFEIESKHEQPRRSLLQKQRSAKAEPEFDQMTCQVSPPKTLELSAGGHCVQVFVRVHKSGVGQTMALRYMGPDTQQRMVTTPSALLNCNPEVPGVCSNPEIDACAAGAAPADATGV